MLVKQLYLRVNSALKRNQGPQANSTPAGASPSQTEFLSSMNRTLEALLSEYGKEALFFGGEGSGRAESIFEDLPLLPPWESVLEEAILRSMKEGEPLFDREKADRAFRTVWRKRKRGRFFRLERWN